MKKLLMTFFILSLSFIVKAQLYNPFLGTVTIESCTNTSFDQYIIKVSDFNDLRKLKFGYQIERNYYIWSRSTLPNRNCQVFKIDSIENLPLGKYNLYVTNLYEAGFVGNAQVGDNLPIVQNTPEVNLPAFLPSTGGDFGTIDAVVQTCMLNDALIKIDSIKYRTLLMVDPVVSLSVIQDSIIILTKESGLTFGDTISIAGTVNYTAIESDDVTLEGDGSPSNQVRLKINGKFDSDNAASGSCPIGEYYELTKTNVYGREEDFLRKRKY